MLLSIEIGLTGIKFSQNLLYKINKNYLILFFDNVITSVAITAVIDQEIC